MFNGHIGAIPVPQAIIHSQEITATAGQKTFNLTTAYQPGYIQVYLDGNILSSSDYTATDGTSIVLVTAAVENQILEVWQFGAFSVALFDHFSTNVDAKTYNLTNLGVLSVGGDPISGYDLTVKNSSDSKLIITSDSGDTELYFDNSGSNLQWIKSDRSAASIKFGISNSEALSLSTNNLSFPWAVSHEHFFGTQFSTTYENGIRLLESGRETRIISKAADATGLISFYVGTTPSEAGRFNSSKNFLVGKTTEAISTAGTAIRGDNPGLINSVRAGTILELNRLSADGNVIDIFQDGTLVGTIGTEKSGFGTSSPNGDGSTIHLHDGSNTYSTLHMTNSSTGSTITDGTYIQTNGSDLLIRNRENGYISWYTNNTERARLLNGGQLIIGGTTAGDAAANELTLVNSGNGGLTFDNGSSSYASIYFKDTGSNNAGYIQYKHGDDFMRFQVDGSELVRFTSDQYILLGQTSANFNAAGVRLQYNGEIVATRNGGNIVSLNRLSSDGALINFAQAGTVEGNISVSGSTISLNGAHTSRWSKLQDYYNIFNIESRVEILRGTVLTNLDEMIEWRGIEFQVRVISENDEVSGPSFEFITKTVSYFGDEPDGTQVTVEYEGEKYVGTVYTEENEQLNKMDISSVKGDRNVAGVFQSWDDDDDEYIDDFYCAMSGDFVIRIAKDCVVERGDLLMSAGDGTACPQEDELADVVRSCTVAKVTSTTVINTFSDGSYLVPCVLMAC
jgi:hypothetical protein